MEMQGLNHCSSKPFFFLKHAKTLLNGAIQVAFQAWNMRWTLLKHTQLTPGGAFFARNAKRAKWNAERWGALTWSALGWIELIDWVFNIKNYSANIYIYLYLSIYIFLFIIYILYYIYYIILYYIILYFIILYHIISYYIIYISWIIYIYTYIIIIRIYTCMFVCVHISYISYDAMGLGWTWVKDLFRQRCRHRAPPHLVMTWHSQQVCHGKIFTMLFLNGVYHLFRLGP